MEFKFINDENSSDSNMKDIFSIPIDFVVTSRKVGMKVLKNRKKMLLLANLSA